MKPSIQKTEQFLSRKTLAERWGCSIETVKRRQRSGILPPVILGRLVRYHLRDVEAIESAASVKGGVR